MPIKGKVVKESELQEALKKPVIAEKVDVENGHFDIRELSDKDFKQYAYETIEELRGMVIAITQVLMNTDINFQILLKHLGVEKSKLLGELQKEAFSQANVNKKSKNKA